VDDNEDTCLMISVILGQTGYQVTTANSITEGLRLAKTRAFDLYILDLWFKEGSGLELCRQIRALDPTTPIVICSADVYQSVQQQAIDAGAQAFVPKPTEFNQLIKTLSELLKS
jgi:CheY-like chemotaxis protein